MKQVVRRVSMLSLVLGVLSLPAGCAGNRAGEAFQPSMLGPDQAVIYIFRSASSRVRQKPVQIVVNQSPLCELYPGQFIEDVVAPGEYLVRVESNSSSVRQVKLLAGEAAYLQVTTAGLNLNPVMETPEPDLARRLIAGTTRAQP